ncbi:MAG: hypothetical protein OXN89_10650 [Bryobacterales bacterium]|nr:hypothetical protein [Bryobacterales bacterium]
MSVVYCTVVIRVSISDAKAKLSASAYLKLVEQGQSIAICRRNVAVPQLCPIDAEKADRRPVGIDRGRRVPNSFFEPLPVDLVEAFEGKEGDE